MKYVLSAVAGALAVCLSLLNLSVDFGPGRWPLSLLAGVLVALAVLSQIRHRRWRHVEGKSGGCGSCNCSGGSPSTSSLPAAPVPTPPAGSDRGAVRRRGTVRWFNATKGYGFIEPSSGGGKPVFVHISAVERAGLNTLTEGQVIYFEEVTDRGKTSADYLSLTA